MAEIGVGIIGAGFGARVQIPGLRMIPGVRLVGLASSNKERAQAAAAEFGVDGYGDYRALLDRPDLDLVVVASPPPLHHEMVLEAIARQKHVICEKPFATSLHRAEEMLRRAQEAGIVHAIDFEFRYLAGRQALKALIDEGYVGQPRLLVGMSLGGYRANPNTPVKPWSTAREGLGGALGAIGVHFLDASRWLLGDVLELSGRLDTFLHQRIGPDGNMHPATADDSAAITLRLQREAVALIEVNVVARQSIFKLEVHGDRGSLAFEHFSRLLGGQNGEPLREMPFEERFAPMGGRQPDGSDANPLIPAFAELTSRVVARVRGEPAGDFPTFADGVASQRLVDAVIASSDSGRTVRFGL